MKPELLTVVFFWAAAAMALVGALVTVIARNPLRGAMGLLLTIGGIAALFLTLSAEFLATAQLLVYAGAVVILFLFVIMLLGPAAQPPGNRKGLITRSLAALGMGLVSVGGIITMMVTRTTMKFPAVAKGYGSIESMADEVFGKGIVPFELSGALLIVAVVGAVAVARGRQGEPVHKRGSVPVAAHAAITVNSTTGTGEGR
jgi:NADH-quinone oxidoreductase subunit J